MDVDQLLAANEEDASDGDDEEYSSGEEYEDTRFRQRTKLALPEHIAAYLEKKDLNRENEPLNCDQNLVQNVMNNYLIVKEILSSLRWQDKMLCKQVCSTWHSAVQTLRKEQLSAVDFILDVDFVIHHRKTFHSAEFEKSGEFTNEPLAVLSFANIKGFNLSCICQEYVNSPCNPPCHNAHFLIDVLQQYTIVPKDCMLTSISPSPIYMPLSESRTADHTITWRRMFTYAHPLIAGVYIPVIEGVKFEVINVRNANRSSAEMQKEFYSNIDRIAENRIIKGLIVYVTEKFLLQTVEDILFLDYIKKIQPDIPYALAGCIVEETMFENSDINAMVGKYDTSFVSENFISIGIFTVPKIANSDAAEKHNFDIYSLVIESSEWMKPKIQQAINEFSKKVCHFEHSVALKLSCVGRDQKHDVEQDYFRAAFPHTPIAGCYGNGELGVNHPARDPPKVSQRAAKRTKTDSEEKGLMYSYSTVFMYIGWGKVTCDEAKKV